MKKQTYDRKAALGAVYTPTDLGKWVAEEALSYLGSRAARALACDPACGDGELLSAVRSAQPATRIIGIDIDPEALRAARSRCNATRLIESNAILSPPGKTLKAHWRKLLGAGSPDLFILNPPWGIDFRSHRDRLHELGFSLATGQFDSFEIFCEASISYAKPGTVLAFILPDSIFYPEKQAFRRLLLNECKLLLIARLGEGFFEAVFRATSVVIVQKGLAPHNHHVRCLRLMPADRGEFKNSYKSLQQVAADRYHQVLQSRFASETENRFDIDLRDYEEKTVSKFSMHEAIWADWLKSTRGVEISKTGKIALCPRCKHANPFPRENATAVCKFCNRDFPADDNSTSIIFPFSKSQPNARRIIVGEDVDRYAVGSSRVIKENICGIDYKQTAHGVTPRILIRKTGLGIKAALDTSTDYTNQVVFMYHRQDQNVPDFFLYYVLGVLCSRVTLAYFLRTHGEVEWKSHPYVTQKIINNVPIPLFTQGSRLERQARAIADAVKFFCETGVKEKTRDVFIDCLVAGLYKLSRDDCRWVVNVMNEAQALEPIRTLRLEGYELLTPHLVK
jgi:hypothetical protein